MNNTDKTLYKKTKDYQSMRKTLNDRNIKHRRKKNLVKKGL